MSIRFEPAATGRPADAVLDLSNGNAFELLRRLGLADAPRGAIDTGTLRAVADNALNAIAAANSNALASQVNVSAPSVAAAVDTMAWLDSHTDLGTPDTTDEDFIQGGHPAGYFRQCIGWLLEVADHADALGADVQWG